MYFIFKLEKLIKMKSIKQTTNKTMKVTTVWNRSTTSLENWPETKNETKWSMNTYITFCDCYSGSVCFSTTCSQCSLRLLIYWLHIVMPNTEYKTKNGKCVLSLCLCLCSWLCCERVLFGRFVDISFMFSQILMTKQLKINAATCCSFEYHCNWIWSSWVSFFFLHISLLAFCHRLSICAVNKGCFDRDTKHRFISPYRYAVLIHIYIYFHDFVYLVYDVTIFFLHFLFFLKENTVNYFTLAGLVTVKE